MRIAKEIGFVLMVSLGLCAGLSLSAEPPKTDPPPAGKEEKIAESDRWFVSYPLGAKVRTSLHLIIKKSGRADAPVRITCEYTTVQDGDISSMTVENLCLNDEWFSPVKVDVRYTGEGGRLPRWATFTRPDPKTTAGTLLCEVGLGGQRPYELQMPEHLVLTISPLEIVRRMPFEKHDETGANKALTFPMFRMLERKVPDITDCSLRYVGERTVAFREGKPEKLHFFFQQIGGLKTDAWSEYALNAKHELVYVQMERMSLLLSTEAEARKSVEVEKPPEPAK